MERDRAASKYANDPRVEWLPNSVATCKVAAGSLAYDLSHDYLSHWDREVFDDEWLEVRFQVSSHGGDSWHVYLVSASRSQEMTSGDGFLFLDAALYQLVGDPQ